MPGKLSEDASDIESRWIDCDLIDEMCTDVVHGYASQLAWMWMLSRVPILDVEYVEDAHHGLV